MINVNIYIYFIYRIMVKRVLGFVLLSNSILITMSKVYVSYLRSLVNNLIKNADRHVFCWHVKLGHVFKC